MRAYDRVEILTLGRRDHKRRNDIRWYQLVDVALSGSEIDPKHLALWIVDAS